MVEIACDLLAAQARVDQPLTRTSKTGAPPGWTPLMTAACRGHADICEVLLVAEANPNAQTHWPGMTPLHAAAMVRSNADDVVRTLAAARADPDVRACFPLAGTPLHLAALFNNPDVCEALLEVRADSCARCRTLVGSGTALDLATEWNRQGAMAVLARASGP